MNKAQAKKKIMDVLVDKRGSVFAPSQPGRFMSILMHDIGLGSANGSSPRLRGVVSEALEALEREKKITLDRVGQNIVGMSRARESRMDPTERSPQSKREHMFAKDTPAYLPDELCSPVTVRHVDPSTIVKGRPTAVSTTAAEAHTPDAKIVVESEQPQPSVPTQADVVIPSYTVGDPYHVTLTNCLRALRSLANDEGVGEGLSVRRVLMDTLNMTNTQASRAMDYLSSMELYVTTMSGFATSSYTLEMSVETITPEMVTQVRTDNPRLVGGKSKEKATSSDNPLERLADIVNDLERQLASVTTDRDALKKKLGKADETIAKRDRQLATANNRVADRDAKLATAQEQIETLKAQLAECQKLPAAPASSRVADVLARYSTK